MGEATCRPFAPPQALPPHLVRWDVIHLPILCLERCGAIKVHVDHFACDDRQGGRRGPSLQACCETMYGVHLNACLSTDERPKKRRTPETRAHPSLGHRA